MTTGIGGGNLLLRINPDSGATTAQFATDAGMDFNAGPTFADGRLWLALIWRGTVTVRGLDPISLATTRVAAAGPDPRPATPFGLLPRARQCSWL